MIAVDPSARSAAALGPGAHARSLRRPRDFHSLDGITRRIGQAGADDSGVAGADAAGFDVILIGRAGQSEVDIARGAYCYRCRGSGLGDDIRTVAGILEIADILAVNKCDLPGAGRPPGSFGRYSKWLTDSPGNLPEDRRAYLAAAGDPLVHAGVPGDR